MGPNPDDCPSVTSGTSLLGDETTTVQCGHPHHVDSKVAMNIVSAIGVRSATATSTDLDHPIMAGKVEDTGARVRAVLMTKLPYHCPGEIQETFLTFRS